MMLSLFLEIATQPATESGAVDFTLTFIKMMAALVVVCVLAVLILRYAVPRFGIMKRFQSGKSISIIGRTTLEQKRHLYLVKVGDKYALIGSSEGGVTHIMDVPKEEVDKEDV